MPKHPSKSNRYSKQRQSRSKTQKPQPTVSSSCHLADGNATSLISQDARNSFYEALVLWKELRNRTREPIYEDQLESAVFSLTKDQKTLDRYFLETLARISERDWKNPNAIVAEQCEERIVLHVAQNNFSEEDSKKVCEYLNDLLEKLRTVTQLNAGEVREYILAKSLEFCKESLNQCRIWLISGQLKCFLRDFARKTGTQDPLLAKLANLEKLLEEAKDKANPLLEKAEDKANPNLKAICQLCEELSVDLPKITDKSHPAYSKMALNLREKVGRLGYRIDAVKFLVAVAQLPMMANKEIEAIPHPCFQQEAGPLYTPDPDLSTVLERLKSAYGETSISFDAIPNTKRKLLTRVLKLQAHRKRWNPCIHAELALLEWAHKRKLNFVNNDKFIACSKAACYCCFLYIQYHPGNFVKPTTHKNAYLDWQAPELVENGIKQASDCIEPTLKSMARQLQKELLEKIWHPLKPVPVTENDIREDLNNGGGVGAQQ